MFTSVTSHLGSNPLDNLSWYTSFTIQINALYESQNGRITVVYYNAISVIKYKDYCGILVIKYRDYDTISIIKYKDYCGILVIKYRDYDAISVSRFRDYSMNFPYSCHCPSTGKTDADRQTDRQAARQAGRQTNTNTLYRQGPLYAYYHKHIYYVTCVIDLSAIN